MKPGTQIAYVPRHARGDIKHKDVEFGFVISRCSNNKAHFCRYWRKGELGSLRTTANSELTPDELLVEHKSVEEVIVLLVFADILGARDVFPGLLEDS